MRKRTDILKSILTVSRLQKSSLLNSDVEVFLKALDDRGVLLQHLAEVGGDNSSEDTELLLEIKELETVVKKLFTTLYKKMQSGRDNNRKEINKIKFTRNLFKTYSIEPLSGGKVDMKE